MGIPLDDTLRKQLTDLVTGAPVVLFMKGTRQQPQCGFSAEVVRILDELGPRYETMDVLASPALRDGIKEFSSWPTIPQLYVRGQFVGGCDIVRELHGSGELAKLLDVPVTASAPPAITISDSAAEAFRATLADAPGDFLRLTIDARFENDLFLGPREPKDVEVQANGLTVLFDPQSARRAAGLHVDFVAGPKGGFKLTNPNEPPSVKQLSAPELKAMLDRGEVILFDVRPEAERARAKIAAARSLDAEGQAYLLGLDRGTAIAFHCHHGIRSESAAQAFLREGFRKVYNLAGGIEAWSQSVDPSVPRY